MIITCHAHTHGATHDVRANVDMVRKLVDVYQEGWGHTVKVDAGVKVIAPICIDVLIKQINETRDTEELAVVSESGGNV